KVREQAALAIGLRSDGRRSQLVPPLAGEFGHRRLNPRPDRFVPLLPEIRLQQVAHGARRSRGIDEEPRIGRPEMAQPSPRLGEIAARAVVDARMPGRRYWAVARAAVAS